MNVINEALNILKINSVSSNGNREIVKYLKALLQKLKLHSHIQETTYNKITQQNLISRIKGKTNNEIIFNTHLDTVPPGEPQKWTKLNQKPFEPKTNNDKIYGLGSADVKIDFLCKLKAINKYKNANWKNPLTLIGTFGEEIGLIGAEHFINTKYIKNPKYVFVGEPTELNIVYAHKGMIIIKCYIPFEAKNDTGQGKIFEFEGNAAHGSTPKLGKNAINEFANFIKNYPENDEIFFLEGGIANNVVPDYCNAIMGNSSSNINKKRIIHFFKLIENIEQDLLKYKNDEYDPPHHVLNLGTVKTTQDNFIFTLAFRTLPKQNFQNIIEKIEKNLKTINSKCKITRNNSAMHTPKNNFLPTKALEIIKTINPNSKLITKATLTEATLYNAAGAESIVFGSGKSVGNIHKPNEYNSISQIHKSVDFYEKVIESFCLQHA